MQPAEIVSAIAWAPDIDPAVKQQVEDAIRRLTGGNRPVFDEMTVHRRLEQFVSRHSTAKTAAAALKISTTFMSEMRCGHRPVPNDVLHALGIEKVRSKALFRDL